LGHFSAVIRALPARFRRGKGSPARALLPNCVPSRMLPSRPCRAAAPPRRAREWRTPTTAERLGSGTAGGQFCSPCGSTFVTAAPFPYQKVNRSRFHRGRIIAAVLPCYCCDAACAAKHVVSRASDRLSTATSTSPDKPYRDSERSALSAHAARFRPARANAARRRAHVSAGIGRFDHHPRFRREQDYRHAQPREAQPAMSPAAFPHRATEPSLRMVRAGHREHPRASNHAGGRFVPVSPLSWNGGSCESRFVVAPSIADRLVRSPVDTITAPSGVAIECARAHCRQGTDRHESRLAPVSAKDRSRTTAGITKRDSPCTFPARFAVQPHQISFQGAITARIDTRVARKPWAPVLPAHSLHFPPMTSRHWPLLRGKRFVHRHACRIPCR
jgi:hypothetical protein